MRACAFLLFTAELRGKEREDGSPVLAACLGVDTYRPAAFLEA
jgi:hypothetical protein